MKLALLALVLTAVTPFHVGLGSMSLPVPWLLVFGEALASVGGIWLAARAIRRSRPLWCPAWTPGGAR